MTAAAVDAYIAALPPDQRTALQALRTRIAAHLPAHIKVMSHAMPGFRQPGPKRKMTVGYAAFKRHLGHYSHSDNTIPQIDCRPFKTSQSGVRFTPENPLPAPLVHQIITLRLKQRAEGT